MDVNGKYCVMLMAVPKAGTFSGMVPCYATDNNGNTYLFDNYPEAQAARTALKERNPKNWYAVGRVQVPVVMEVDDDRR